MMPSSFTVVGLLLVVAATCGCCTNAAKIEHVVVLMEENRSFDHMVGWLKRLNPDINGLDGSEFNRVNASDPNSEAVYVNDHGYNVSPSDPCHGFSCVTEQIYGYNKPVGTVGVPKMNGFVQNTAEEKKNISNPMSMFTNESAPIISTLAMEFSLFDAFHCDFPGPTYPNRQYVHSATSHGETSDGVPTGGFPQTLIYDHLAEAGLTWSMFYEDSLAWALFLSRLRLPSAKPHLQHIDNFMEQAKTGKLPNYTFIEPRIATNANGPANSQHPDGAVSAGEALIKQVYEAVRNGPLWEKTLLIITYDEHGGFYDHVAPPQTGVPSPDGIDGANGFKFDRLGIRVPFLAISPWINKGTLVHEAKGPTPTSHYTLSSIPATMKKLFGLPKFLTARDEWAGTFEWLWEERTTPRTDCPTTLPPIAGTPAELRKQQEVEEALPINDKQREAIRVVCELNKSAACGHHLRYQHEVSEFLAYEFQKWLDRDLNEL